MYLHNEVGRFNEDTGELLFYQNTPRSRSDILSDERHFYNSRDREELFDIVKRYQEKRYSDVIYFLDKSALGKWYIPILTLCSKVDYFNVGFHDRLELCSIFGVSDSNLNKTLNKFQRSNLLKYTGKGLTKSHQIKVIWNPINVWKGYEHSVTKAVCIQDWYKGYFGCVDSDSINVECGENTATVEYKDISPKYSPDPYISPYFKFGDKDKFNWLMGLSDAEFEIMLLKITQEANASS